MTPGLLASVDEFTCGKLAGSCRRIADGAYRTFIEDCGGIGNFGDVSNTAVVLQQGSARFHG
jgi:hypothetical protein